MSNPSEAVEAALRALDASSPDLDEATARVLSEKLSGGERALFETAARSRQELRQLHERVLRSARFAEASLGTAAFIHEIRQCLAPLMGFADLMREAPSSPYIPEWAGEISGQSKRLAELVSRHADLLRSDAGGDELVDVREVIDESRYFFAKLPPRVKLEVIIAPDLPRAVSHRRRLLHALINLLANARDAHKDIGGTIAVLARAGNNQVELVIADQGSGVDPAIRDRLFEPLFTTKREHGTGLGLYLSRELLKPRGDLVLLPDDALPAGAKTAFAIRMPAEGTVTLAAKAEPLIASGPPPLPRSDPSEALAKVKRRALEELAPILKQDRPYHVVLVEDEPKVRRMTKVVLELIPNTKIFEAPDVAAALAFLDRTDIDFLVCDKNLPDGDGLEVIKKAKEKLPQIDAMIVTGYPSAESAADAIRVGVTDYLLKPVREIQMLRTSVSTALVRQRMQRLWQRQAGTFLDLGRELQSVMSEGDPQRALLVDINSRFAHDFATAPFRVAVIAEPEVAALEAAGMEVVALASPGELSKQTKDIDLLIFAAEVAPDVVKQLVAITRSQTWAPHLLAVGTFAHADSAVAAISGRTGFILDRPLDPDAIRPLLSYAGKRRRLEVRGDALAKLLQLLGHK